MLIDADKVRIKLDDVGFCWYKDPTGPLDEYTNKIQNRLI